MKRAISIYAVVYVAVVLLCLGVRDTIGGAVGSIIVGVLMGIVSAVPTAVLLAVLLGGRGGVR